METLQLTKKEIRKLSENQIIELIHNDFNSAPKRIENDLNSLLKSLNIVLESDIEALAKRHLAVGFKNTDVVRQYEKMKVINSINEIKVKDINNVLSRLEYYKQKYPTLTYITQEELNKICEKYDLIYAPVQNYIKDVPDANLKEIANAKNFIKDDDRIKSDLKSYIITVSKFNKNIGEDVKNCLKEFEINNKTGVNSTLLSKLLNSSYLDISDVNKALISYLNYQGIECNSNIIGENAKTGRISLNDLGINIKEYTKIKTNTLYIAAPINNFDLSDLAKNSRYGFGELKELKPMITNDPIVLHPLDNDDFLVLSKWGLEAGDEKLVNPLNN